VGTAWPALPSSGPRTGVTSAAWARPSRRLGRSSAGIWVRRSGGPWFSVRWPKMVTALELRSSLFRIRLHAGPHLAGAGEPWAYAGNVSWAGPRPVARVSRPGLPRRRSPAGGSLRSVPGAPARRRFPLRHTSREPVRPRRRGPSALPPAPPRRIRSAGASLSAGLLASGPWSLQGQPRMPATVPFLFLGAFPAGFVASK